jgi:hypothetical protein
MVPEKISPLEKPQSQPEQEVNGRDKNGVGKFFLSIFFIASGGIFIFFILKRIFRKRSK